MTIALQCAAAHQVETVAEIAFVALGVAAEIVVIIEKKNAARARARGGEARPQVR